VHGTQTAIVVGPGPVHTDRDHRVKVQFHWQRGSRSSHGLEGEHGCNAPGSDASFTWVRVGEMLAGANWGSNFVPRVGQEVVVAFEGGDVDRPVVVGAVYNGVGQADAQGNTQGAGRAGATGNAPAWFAGSKQQGKFEGHAHAAVLAGLKSQELATSASGMGGYNQLVLDNTPGGHRIELSSTTAASRLQLGHLLHQNDNQRLAPRGHGVDLTSGAFGALRAGSGVLISAHAKPNSTGQAQQMDSSEPRAVLQSMRELGTSLADTAHKHEAKVAGEAEPAKLAVFAGHETLYESLSATDGGDGADDGDAQRIGGGLGKYAVFGKPQLVLAAPGGIGWFTPGTAVASSGTTTSLIAGHDLTVTAQRHHASAVDQGMVWFTYGNASNASKPNAETGIKLHAATGSVRISANSDRMLMAAQKKVAFASTNDAVTVGSPKHVLLNAAGSAIKLDGNITLTTGGPAVFKAAIKELTGTASASSSLSLPKSPFKGCAQSMATAIASQSATVTLA
jgi:type VI secretion system secreted protein VgrG